MNLIDIAIFKHFIRSRDLRHNFIKKYKKSRTMTKNPESIEAYLSNVEPESVITKAITLFHPNETFGFDFWNNLDNNWQNFYKHMKADHATDQEVKILSLAGVYQVLCENWDTDKPHLYETREQTIKRLGLAYMLHPIKEEEPVKVEEQTKEEEKPLVDSSNDSDPLSDFDFFDDVVPRSHKLKSNEVSLNYKDSYKITFNTQESECIKKSGLTLARLAKKNNDFYLIINNEKGSNISNLAGRKSKQNITINSKDICVRLRVFLSIKETYSKFTIEKLQSTSDYIIYKLIKQ